MIIDVFVWLDIGCSGSIAVILLCVVAFRPGKDFLPELCGPCDIVMILPCLFADCYEHDNNRAALIDFC